MSMSSGLIQGVKILLLIILIGGMIWFIVNAVQMIIFGENKAVNFASPSNAECMLTCADMGKISKCYAVTPSYTSSFREQAFINGTCSCFMEKCAR